MQTFLKNPIKEFIFSKVSGLEPASLLKKESFTGIVHSKFTEYLF